MNSRKYWRKRGLLNYGDQRGLLSQEEFDKFGEEKPYLDKEIYERLNGGETMAEVEAEYEYVDEERDGHSEYYHTDEEAENNEGQKEDMKIYLSKLNKKIDIFVYSLKAAENEISN